MTGLLRDLKYGLRMLAKNPGFTALERVARCSMAKAAKWASVRRAGDWHQ